MAVGSAHDCDGFAEWALDRVALGGWQAEWFSFLGLSYLSGVEFEAFNYASIFIGSNDVIFILAIVFDFDAFGHRGHSCGCSGH